MATANEQILTALNNQSLTAEGLYKALRSAHGYAVSHNESITYPANRTIYLTVPADEPYSMPLPLDTNFNGCHFIVTNNAHDLALFSMVNTGTAISFNRSDIYKLNNLSSSYPNLGPGPKLLKITDAHWTYAYSDYFDRQDILFINNHVIQNDPITGYGDCLVEPSYLYYDVTIVQKTIKNAKLTRTSGSTYITKFLWVVGQYNVKVSNIEIYTPSPGTLTGENCISIHDSAKIVIQNVSFNGTYSNESNFGYGISVINVWDSTFTNISCTNTIWGLFGNRCVNTASLNGCSINRFDIHCYGRDILCVNCTFKKTNSLSSTSHIYNRYSSMYGYVTYRYCTFEYFRPLRIDPAYNAYTPFSMTMENCILKVSDFSKCIVDLMEFNTAANSRTELLQKYLPSITIENLTLEASSDVSSICLFKLINDVQLSDALSPTLGDVSLDITSFTQSGGGSACLIDSDHIISLKSKGSIAIKKKTLGSSLIPVHL